MYNEEAAKYSGTMAVGFALLSIDPKKGTPSTSLGPKMGMEATSLSRTLKSMEENNLIIGAKAGADFLLSLQEKSIWIMDEVDSIPVIIPDFPKEEKKFYKLIERLQKNNKEFILSLIHI